MASVLSEQIAYLTRYLGVAGSIAGCDKLSFRRYFVFILMHMKKIVVDFGEKKKLCQHWWEKAR